MARQQSKKSTAKTATKTKVASQKRKPKAKAASTNIKKPTKKTTAQKTAQKTAARKKASTKSRPKKMPTTAAGKAPMEDVQPLRPDAGEVVVRMYRQGLGDCFLLAFGTQDIASPRYVLIDCGIHMRQQDGNDRLFQVMRHLAAATQNHIHVVVATHEHADHLSGFVQKESPFLKKSLSIGQLWVGWTEKFGDRDADRLRKEKATARAVIKRAVQEAISKNNRGLAAFAEQLNGLLDFESPAEHSFEEPERESVIAAIQELADEKPELKSMLPGFLSDVKPRGLGLAAAANRKKPSSNELALGLLAAKADDVRYCNPGDVLAIPDVKGIRAFALGPPKDDQLLKKDRPSKVRGGHAHEYKETYLSGSVELQSLGLAPALDLPADADDGPLAADQRHPFTFEFRRGLGGKRQAASNLWGEQMKRDKSTDQFFQRYYFNSDNQWRSIDGDWLAPAEALALKLDSDTNNTSLALAFELGPPGRGSVLLFPGDAQVGNWLSWRGQSYEADGKKITADDLLKRTLVYKVGHHGSHNATLKNFVSPGSDEDGQPYGLELMQDIIAMIPVDRAAADKPMPTPWRMPHLPLYERLRTKSDRRVLRSDLSNAPLSKSEPKDIFPTSTGWTKVPGKPALAWRRSVEEFQHGTEGPLYYDIRIPVQ